MIGIEHRLAASAPRRHCRDRPAACHRPRGRGWESRGGSRRRRKPARWCAAMRGHDAPSTCSVSQPAANSRSALRVMPSWPIVSKASPTKAAMSMRLGFALRNAARHEVEEMIVVRGRPRWRHGRRPRRRRRFQVRAWHRIRPFRRAASAWLDCLPSVFCAPGSHDDLALEDAARMIVHHAFEELRGWCSGAPGGQPPGAYRRAACRPADRRRKSWHRHASPVKCRCRSGG